MSFEFFRIRPFVVIVCTALMLFSSARMYGHPGPDNTNPESPPVRSGRAHWYSGFSSPYTTRVLPPASVSNSTRMNSVLRAGKLYLSLSDTIALAVENNLDVEVERYVFPMAEADLLRARSGASAQGIPTGVVPGISSAPGLNILGSASAGLPASGAATSLAPGQGFDPLVTATVNWDHSTTPESNGSSAGTSALVTTGKTANFSIGQTFPTGGTAVLSFGSLNQFQNSLGNSTNPGAGSSLDLTITQPLLQGFGLALNNRTIRIAKNNLRAADLVFKQQVINTVANIVSLYWNLVAANLSVDVRNQAVAVSEKLYADNRQQVEIGTLAPIEVVRAEAQLASDQQGLVQAQGAALQLEFILKSALSRNGLTDPSLAEARVVVTDRIRIPEVEAVEPIEDLVSRALENRPDLAQSRMQIDNSKIALQGTKNTLLPTLSAVADLRNNTLASTQNGLIGPSSQTTGLVQASLGGGLGQLFRRNFPDYTVGLNLSVPLRNRNAQANMAVATLNLRQSELQVQRQINQIAVDVHNAVIALQEARAQYQAAVKQRTLEEQTVDADQKKLSLGGDTTIFQVIQDQRDLSTAASNVVTAEAAYIQARVQLDLATGMILQHNNVEFDEAKSGVISRPPTPLPLLDQSGPDLKAPPNTPKASQ